MAMTAKAWEALGVADEIREEDGEDVGDLALAALSLEWNPPGTPERRKDESRNRGKITDGDNPPSSKRTPVTSVPIEQCHDIEYLDTEKCGKDEPTGFFWNVRFQGCFMDNAKIENCHFINVTFNGCTFTDIMWDSIYLKDVSISDCFFDDDIWRNDELVEGELKDEVRQQTTKLGEFIPEGISRPTWVLEQQTALLHPIPPYQPSDVVEDDHRRVEIGGYKVARNSHKGIMERELAWLHSWPVHPSLQTSTNEVDSQRMMDQPRDMLNRDTRHNAGNQAARTTVSQAENESPSLSSGAGEALAGSQLATQLQTNREVKVNRQDQQSSKNDTVCGRADQHQVLTVASRLPHCEAFDDGAVGTANERMQQRVVVRRLVEYEDDSD